MGNKHDAKSGGKVVDKLVLKSGDFITTVQP